MAALFFFARNSDISSLQPGPGAAIIFTVAECFFYRETREIRPFRLAKPSTLQIVSLESNQLTAGHASSSEKIKIVATHETKENAITLTARGKWTVARVTRICVTGTHMTRHFYCE